MAERVLENKHALSLAVLPHNELDILWFSVEDPFLGQCHAKCSVFRLDDLVLDLRELHFQNVNLA
jgi:hypothetical protein